ncbi:MAG: hypothetical protein QNJ45_15780 [Ardenticatenaceae bacterium]|nr:hypothetical protein [Ardenticatenaceae bacterium]
MFPSFSMRAALQSIDRLPLLNNLRWAYLLSIPTAVFTLAASLIGLSYQTEIYPTEALRLNFVANDVVNLFIGLPILLLSMWLAHRGRLIGLLWWPGALLYLLYNALIYVFTLPLNWVFLLSLIVLAFSLYGIAILLTNIDSQFVRFRLTGAFSERLIGGILIVFGGAIILRAVGLLGLAIVNQTTLPASEVGLHIADFLIAMAWLIGGILIWRHRAMGYVMSIGLLFQASMLIVGLIVFLLLQPRLANVPLPVTDLIVIAVFGLIILVPFLLSVRGVITHDKGTET